MARDAAMIGGGIVILLALGVAGFFVSPARVPAPLDVALEMQDASERETILVFADGAARRTLETWSNSRGRWEQQADQEYGPRTFAESSQDLLTVIAGQEGFFELGSTLLGGPGTSYTLTLRHDGRLHRVQCSVGSCPPGFQKLEDTFRELWARATVEETPTQ